MIVLTNSIVAKFKEDSEKLRKSKPKVRFIDFGKYKVQSSDRKSWYDVFCKRLDSGERIVACSCIAGEMNRTCKHAIAATMLHISVATIRKNREEILRRKNEKN